MTSVLIAQSSDCYRVQGEVVAATAPLLAELADLHGPLRLDLSGVTFMDSSGIAGLVRLYQRCEHDDCSFRIVDCSSQVKRLLQLVDLYDRFIQTDGDEPPAVEAGVDAAKAN